MFLGQLIVVFPFFGVRPLFRVLLLALRQSDTQSFRIKPDTYPEFEK